MYTVGEIAKRFSISRSTLLYYDSIGVLKPSERSASNYRLYSECDFTKMKRIKLYREAGISLKLIGIILEKEHTDTFPILENRLSEINNEIKILRTQQSVILAILEREKSIRKSRIMTEKQWVSLLSSAGLDEDNLMQFHIEFERMAPEAHQDFLESLGMQAKEASLIREMSKPATLTSDDANSADIKN